MTLYMFSTADTENAVYVRTYIGMNVKSLAAELNTTKQGQPMFILRWPIACLPNCSLSEDPGMHSTRSPGYFHRSSNTMTGVCYN